MLRRGLPLFAAVVLFAALAPPVSAQQRNEEAETQSDGRQIDPVTGRVCRPLCAEDMSPCDPPTMKAREGRCSSPTAGFVGS